MKLFLSLRTEQIKNFLCCNAALELAGCFGYAKIMLSVVIQTRGEAGALARTLSSLVSGAVEGAVREVIICDDEASPVTRSIADHTGCHYLPHAPLARGIAQARSEWVMLLEPGARLLDGWIDVVLAHTVDGTHAARFTQSARPWSLWSIFSARRPLGEGLILTRRQALALARGEGNAETIARRVSARRLPAQIQAAQAR